MSDKVVGAGQAVILGAVTAVGGGTIRDVLVRRVPTVLTSLWVPKTCATWPDAPLTADQLGRACQGVG